MKWMDGWICTDVTKAIQKNELTIEEVPLAFYLVYPFPLSFERRGNPSGQEIQGCILLRIATTISEGLLSTICSVTGDSKCKTLTPCSQVQRDVSAS
jgi:hypothetical protein